VEPVEGNQLQSVINFLKGLVLFISYNRICREVRKQIIMDEW
jgi:hypothetical protein